MTIEDPAAGTRANGPAPGVVRDASEEALARLRATHHDLVTAPAVSESLLMTRNVAVVQALEAGVPANLVRTITRMNAAALELAVARGTYYRDHAPRHA